MVGWTVGVFVDEGKIVGCSAGAFVGAVAGGPVGCISGDSTGAAVGETAGGVGIEGMHDGEAAGGVGTDGMAVGETVGVITGTDGGVVGSGFPGMITWPFSPCWYIR